MDKDTDKDMGKDTDMDMELGRFAKYKMAQ
jgi:hypothetical protein